MFNYQEEEMLQVIPSSCTLYIFQENIYRKAVGTQMSYISTYVRKPDEPSYHTLQYVSILDMV